MELKEPEFPIYMWCCGYEDGQPLEWYLKPSYNDVNAIMKDAKNAQGRCPNLANRDRTHAVKGFTRNEFIKIVLDPNSTIRSFDSEVRMQYYLAQIKTGAIT